MKTNLLIILLLLTILSCNRWNTRGIKKSSFHGRVCYKYIEWNGHVNAVKLNDSTGIGLIDWEQVSKSLFDYIEIDDSISKNKGEYSLFIYKKDGRIKEFKYIDENGKIYKNKEGDE